MNRSAPGVLVTRPEAQAGELSRLLAAAGCRVYHLPALETRPCADLAALAGALGPLDHYRYVVFVSANAVRHGASLLRGQGTHHLVAVGPATAAALVTAGHAPALVPARGYTSEDLLASPQLQDVRGARILIVRGSGGRDVLADTLNARGAEVRYADVYERVRAVPPPGAVEAVEQAWANGAIDVVTATSGEVLRCLMELLTPMGRALARDAVLLVGGERLGREARRMGYEGELVVAESPESAALVAALGRWRARD